MKLRASRGQSLAEYSVVIAFVLAAAIGMQVFAKRGLQARIKTATDQLGSITVNNAKVAGGDSTAAHPVLKNFTSLEQYEPYYASSNMKTDRNDSNEEQLDTGNLTRKGTTPPVDGKAAVMLVTRGVTDGDVTTQDQTDEQLTFNDVKTTGGYDQNWK